MGEKIPDIIVDDGEPGEVHSVVRNLIKQLEDKKTVPLPLDAIDGGEEDSAAPGTVGDGEWVNIRNGVTVDSGSAAFVLPVKWLPGIPMEKSKGSMAGQEFIGATGKVATNMGQKLVKFRTNLGQDRGMTFQCTDVNKALACVAGIADGPAVGEEHQLFLAQKGASLFRKSWLLSYCLKTSRK